MTALLAGAPGGQKPDGSVSQGPDRAEHGLPGGAAVLHPEAQCCSGAERKQKILQAEVSLEVDVVDSKPEVLGPQKGGLEGVV